ncbi:MAG: alpha-mannosidase, partial [Chryseobacterium sp.]
IVLNPVINGGGVSFKELKTVTISAPEKNSRIFYTTDGSTPTKNSIPYTKSLKFTNTIELKAVAVNKDGVASFVTTAYFKKAPHNWSITLGKPYEQQYDGGGNDGLIDAVRGSTNWRKGNWQGYQKVNPEFIIDLKKVTPISTVTAGFLQDSRAWIIVPKEFIIETSMDGKNFTQVYKGENFLPADDLNIQVKNIVASFPKTNAQFVKVTAVQFGKMPAWSEGAGGDTHIFVDEIIVE